MNRLFLPTPDHYHAAMRYSFRTILIFTSLCCVYAAWVGHVRNKAAHHRQQSAMIITSLTEQSEMEMGDIETLVSNIASRSRGRIDFLRFDSLRSGVGTLPGVELKVKYLEVEHRKAANHKILARTFDQAVWQPWKIVNARFSP